jgi:hypothetical protein
MFTAYWTTINNCVHINLEFINLALFPITLRGLDVNDSEHQAYLRFSDPQPHRPSQPST